MPSDLTFTAGNVFVSDTSGGTTPVTLIHTGKPFFIEAPAKSSDLEEFNEGKAYSLQIAVTNLATGAVFLNTTVVGGQGDKNFPTFPNSQIEVPAGNAGAVGDIYSIVAVLLSGRVPPTVDIAFGSSLVVVIP
jgi:FlaG/FlaF family flagellin (archaellin)